MQNSTTIFKNHFTWKKEYRSVKKKAATILALTPLGCIIQILSDSVCLIL